MKNTSLINMGNNYRLNWDQGKNILYVGPYYSDFTLAIRHIELLKFEFGKLSGTPQKNKISFKLIRKSPTSFNVELTANDNLIDVAYNIDEFHLWKFYSLLKGNCHVVFTVFYDDKYSRRTECLAKTEKLGITIR